MSELIYVHDPDTLETKNILDELLSLQWERKFQAPGAFELHIKGNAEVEEEQLISKGTDIGVIEYVKKSYKAETGDQTIIKGRFLSCYAERRIVPGIKTISSGTREYIMKKLVTDNMTSTAGVDRAFPMLSVAEDHGYSSDAISYQTENTNLLKELEALAEAADLGFGIRYINKTLLFDVLQGLDRTTEQSTNSWAIFSMEFENILTQEYVVDTIDKTNFAYITMPESGSDAALSTTVGSATGRDRREIFVSGSNVRKNESGSANATAVQITLLQAEGSAELTDETLSFSASVDPEGSLEYKVDYDLGDIVSIIATDYGIQLNARITAVKEVEENGIETLKLTFGYDNTKFKNLWR